MPKHSANPTSSRSGPKNAQIRSRLAFVEAIEDDDGAALKALLLACPEWANAPLGTDDLPLSLAARADAPQALRALLDAGADPNATIHPEGLTPLMAAAAHACSKALAVLAPASNLWARDQQGKLAIHWALSGACPLPDADALALIHAMGARVDVADSFGCTPLLLAAQEGNALIFGALLPHSDARAQSKGPGLNSFGLNDAHALSPEIAGRLRAHLDEQAIAPCAAPPCSTKTPSRL